MPTKQNNTKNDEEIKVIKIIKNIENFKDKDDVENNWNIEDEDFKISDEEFENLEIKTDMYSFNYKELMDLKKYLKTKIFGQNDIIDQVIDNLLMNTYRTQNNDKNLWTFLQFWPSWSGKNYLWQLIAEKLWFAYQVIDVSSMHFVEMSSLLWVTSGYWNWDQSILENIYEKSISNWKKAILIFDEFDKWQVTDNADCAKFLMSLMSILDSKKVRTKDTNVDIYLSNFIFVFNSNYGFDNFKIEKKESKKIWFETEDKNEIKKTVKQEKNSITIQDIEYYFKRILRVQVSVYNRLKKSNNIFIFNELERKILEKYKNEKYEELKQEISQHMWVDLKKLPNIEKFWDKFKNYDITRWYRWLNTIIYEEIKLSLIKKYWFKVEKNLFKF